VQFITTKGGEKKEREREEERREREARTEAMHCALMLSSPIITLALSTHVAKPSIGAHQLCTLWRRCKGASVLARGTIIPDFAFANAKVIALALLRARTYLVGFAVARARVLALVSLESRVALAKA